MPYSSRRVTCAALAAVSLQLLVAAGPASAQPSAEQQSALRNNCRSDFMSNCSGVTPGGAEALQCLQRNVAKLSPGCQSAVNALAPRSAPTQAAAPAAPAAPAPAPAAAPAAAPVPSPAAPATRAGAPTPDQQTALRQLCGADYMAKCGHVPPATREALQCLQSKSAELSENCRGALALFSPAGAPQPAPARAAAPAPAAAAPRRRARRRTGPAGRRSTGPADRAATGGDPPVLPGGFHVEVQRRAARRRGRVALPATQLRAALAELPERGRSDRGRRHGCGHRACGAGRGGSRSRRHADGRTAGRDQANLSARLHDKLPRRATRRSGGFCLPATQCVAAVTGLPDVARRSRRRRAGRDCCRRSGSAAAGTVSAAARDPRTDDAPVENQAAPAM